MEIHHTGHSKPRSQGGERKTRDVKLKEQGKGPRKGISGKEGAGQDEVITLL